MKKDVSMVKVVLVILFALSLITIVGVESGITEEYRCVAPGNTCQFNDKSNPIEVYCKNQNWTWKCNVSETAAVECTQSSQKKTFGPSFNFTAYEVCFELCGDCMTDWIRVR